MAFLVLGRNSVLRRAQQPQRETPPRSRCRLVASVQPQPAADTASGARQPLASVYSTTAPQTARMGRPLQQSMFKIDMSHQEMERMLSELEQWYACAGAEWIAAEAAASWLRNDLGECTPMHAA